VGTMLTLDCSSNLIATILVIIATLFARAYWAAAEYIFTVCQQEPYGQAGV
jgi:hypothetical protein